MSDKPELFQDVLDLLDEFEDHQVDYIVVGAHALAAHGIPRATGDFDVLVRPSRRNALRVIAALEAFGAPLSDHGVTWADFSTPDMVYQLGLPPRRIDILTRISGVDFDEAASTLAEFEVQGRRLPVLGREALIRNKRASGRPKDLVDLEALGAG